jgi:hypothetical protein
MMLDGPQFRALCLVLLLTSPAALPAACPSQNQTSAEAAAGEVVERYVTALFNGDLPIIAATQTGELAASKGAILANPDYAPRLRSMYENATSEILRCRAEDDTHIWVDTVIILGNGELVQARFRVVRSDSSGAGVPDFQIELEEAF